jgi:methionyl-tRNA formyltransferase
MNIFIGNYSQVLKVLIEITSVDLIVVEKSKNNSSAIRSIALHNNIQLVEVASSSDIDKALKNKRVHLAVVASFGLILKQNTISACRCIVNFHPGDIERFRGRHPLPQTILNGFPEMAITAHLIDSEAIDAGPILGRLQLPINFTQNYDWNYSRMLDSLSLFAKIILSPIVEGNINSREHSPNMNTYFAPLNKQTLKLVIEAPNLLKFKI